jgi:hypothetical protein
VAANKKSSSFHFGKKAQFITFLVVVAVLGGIGYYSIQQYEETGAEQQGIVICNEEKCEKSIHIHSDIVVSTCGEQLHFPKNKGSVIEQHTHAEQDYLHLHIKFEVDRETEEPLDTTLHELGNFFKNMEIPFSSEPAQLGDYSVGDTCSNGKVLTQEDLKMTVNGEPNTEFEHYVWKDGDDIRLTFE